MFNLLNVYQATSIQELKDYVSNLAMNKLFLSFRVFARGFDENLPGDVLELSAEVRLFPASSVQCRTFAVALNSNVLKNGLSSLRL